MSIQRKESTQSIIKKKLNIELIEDPMLKELYQVRLSQRIADNLVAEEDDVEKIQTNTKGRDSSGLRETKNHI